MKISSQAFGSTSYRSKPKRSKQSSAAEHVTQRRIRNNESGGVKSSYGISKIRKVRQIKPSSSVIQPNIRETEQQCQITLRENRRDSHRDKTSVRGLATEPSLRINEDLRDKERYLCGAPASEAWSMSGEGPYLWKELQFSKNTISTEELCAIIYRSPHLRKLTLRGRQDTDAILNAVLASSHRLQTLELLDCRGSENQDLVCGDILSRIVRKHDQLRNVVLEDTIITASDFYEVLQQYINQLDEVLITIATRKDGLAFLDACSEYSVPVETSHKENSKEVKDLIQLLPNCA
jgi:hypothetical protein